MMYKHKTFTALFILIFSSAFGQMEDYQYKRAITGIEDQWHSLKLPDSIFSKLQDDLADLRVFGFSPSGDTIEAAYLFNSNLSKSETKLVDYSIFNQSSNSEGYYYSFEISEQMTINQIRLDFAEENFDWRVKLEGSQDQSQWFQILNDYRILSIKNNSSDYKYSSLEFSDSKYRYYRVFVPGASNPKLISAQLAQIIHSPGKYSILNTEDLVIRQSIKNKQTEIIIDLPLLLPLNTLIIRVKDDFDYYRPIRIEAISDSIKTEKGWRQITQNIGSGILSSMEKNRFSLNGKLSDKLRVVVDNGDNQALDFDNFSIEVQEYDISIRFNQEADYSLYYGNSKANRPNYDIALFKDKVPGTMASLNLGTEEILEDNLDPSSPLFNNKNWLWAIMAAMIVLLGGFTFKMIKSKE